MGGGALRDIGVYPSISTRFVSGEEPVAVPYAAIEWDAGIDATARVVAEFPGFGMDFYVSMRMAPRQVMTFHGDKGWLSRACALQRRRLRRPGDRARNAEATVVLERFPRSDHYRAQIDAFNASVLDGAPYACPLEFSRGNQVMIDMIYAAAGIRVNATDPGGSIVSAAGRGVEWRVVERGWPSGLPVRVVARGGSGAAAQAGGMRG